MTSKINRKKSLAECMINPKRCGRYACSLKLETDSILLMKLRSIFHVNMGLFMQMIIQTQN